MMSATTTFLTSLASVGERAQDARIEHLARLRLMDWVGCALAGAASDRLRVMTMLDLAHEENGVTPVVGLNRSASPSMAAMINGMLAHSAEFDDGNRFGMVHPGAPVIAGLLAVAIPRQLSDQDIIRGIVVGYEAAICLARMVQPNAKDAGWHATGICGGIGAAMGLGSALSLDAVQMNAALSAAATASAGMLKVLRDTSDLKPYNAGHAAQIGVSAVLLAQSGFQGPLDVLGGQHGYIHMMGGQAEFSFDGLQWRDPLGIEQIYVKPYASCRHAHAPVEAALVLRSGPVNQSGDIVKIRIATHRLAVHLHDHTVVDGAQSAKMSVPYCTAAALATGYSGLAAFSSDALKDPEIVRLMQVTEVVENTAMSALVPHKRPALLEVTLSSGERHAYRVDLPKGEPETPVSEGELRDKFVDLSIFAGNSAEQTQRIIDVVLGQSGRLVDGLAGL